MPDLRTEAAVAKLVEAATGDLEELVVELTRAKDLAEALVDPCRGMNGLSAFLRGQVVLLGEAISSVQKEAETVRKNMLGESSLPPVEVLVQDGERVAERVKA